MLSFSRIAQQALQEQKKSCDGERYDDDPMCHHNKMSVEDRSKDKRKTRQLMFYDEECCDDTMYSAGEGILNAVFEESFENDTTEKKMFITRLDTYSKANKFDDNTKRAKGRLTTDAKEDIPMSRHSRGTMVALKKHLRKITTERLTIQQIFTRYVEHSTLHGFRYTFSDIHFLRRIFWGILMILGAIYFLVKLKEGILEYFEYPFSTLTTVDFVGNLTFPAISLCPINNFKLDAIKNNNLHQLYLENRFPLEKNWSDPGYDIPGDEFVSLLRQSSVQIEDIFEDCDWIRRNTNHPLINRTLCGATNFTSYFNNNGQLCYTVNGIKQRPLLEVDQSGILYGYEFMFDLKASEVLNSHPYAGIQFIIHHQSEPPGMEQGFSVSPGFKTFVSMDLIETTNLPPPYATKCGDKELKYHRTYSRKACLLELLTDYATNRCNCREPFMPDNGYPYCSLKQTILCMFQAKESFNQYEMLKECPVECDVISYKYRLSDSRFIHNPPKGLELKLMLQNAYKKGLNETHLMKLFASMTIDELDDYIENNLINIIFFYREMEKQRVEQEASFDFYQFLGDMGGEIGLMLGASLLTFVEFIDLIIFVVYHQLLRLHKSKR